MLVEFIHQGRCVVVGTYGNCTSMEAPGGAWRDNNYNPILLKGQIDSPQIFESPPLHPIFTHVKFVETVNNIATGDVHEKATLISQYTSGRPMVVWLPVGMGGVVSVNFVPAQGEEGSIGGWIDKTGNDGKRVISNIMWYALNNFWSVLHINKI